MITGDTPFTRVGDLTAGAMARVRVRLSQCDTKNGKGGAYLSGTLQDSDATVPFKIWSSRQDVFVHYATGKVVEAVIKVSTYKNELQCTIESEQFLTPTQAAEYADELIPSSKMSEEELIEEFTAFIDKAHEIDPTWPPAEEVIKALDKAKLWDLYKSVPAAVQIHQAYIRGLLEHSILVTRIAVSTASAVPNANIPLVIFGALFHDLGKCTSFAIDSTGLASSVSEAGALLGHLVMGATYIPSVFKKILSPDKRLLVAHICISHHGRYEWGSAILPAFKEAQIVHEADYLDSKMGAFVDAETKNRPEIISEKSWMLDRYLLTTGANLPPEPEEEDDDTETE